MGIEPSLFAPKSNGPLLALDGRPAVPNLVVDMGLAADADLRAAMPVLSGMLAGVAAMLPMCLSAVAANSAPIRACAMSS